MSTASSRSRAAQQAARTRTLNAPIKPVRLGKRDRRALDAATETAVECWLDSHPAGRTDNGGRWYPSAAESADCCSGVYSPSRAHPWTLFKHGHSDAHRVTRDGVDASIVRAIKRVLVAQSVLTGEAGATASVEMVRTYGVDTAKRLTAARFPASEALAAAPTLRTLLEREAGERMVRALAKSAR